MSPTTRQEVRTLAELVPRVHQCEGFAPIVEALREKQSASLDGTWGSACALTSAALAKEAPGTVLIVLPRINEIDDFALDLAGFFGDDETPLIFPAWETLPQEQNVTDVVFGQRLRMLNELSHTPAPKLIVTSITALLQQVPTRKNRLAATRTLSVGDELESEAFLRWLVDRGFDRTTAIELPGEFCVHGGIIDVFPPDSLDPLRIELFGDEIESIRRFDVETQRKLEDLQSAMLTVIAPVETSESNGSTGTQTVGENFLDSLPADSWVILSELQELMDEGKLYLSRLEDKSNSGGDPLRGLYSIPSVLGRCADFGMATLAGLAADRGDAHCRLPIESLERLSTAKEKVWEEFASLLDVEDRAIIACHNEAELQRLSEMLTESHPNLKEQITLTLGYVQRGFRLLTEQLIVISDHELFGRTTVRRSQRRKKGIESRVIDNFLDLKAGDLIVHLAHGIGRYRGMKLLDKDEQIEEHLVLEFRNKVRLYVPVSLIHLVQRYVGTGKPPELSKVGGTAWEKKKLRVADAVTDMASDMIRLQAEREAHPGIAFPPDSEWQQEFEAAFPYQETDDQLDAIDALRGDMERERPMDRLICGDVGYGKTEVAMRAAFKAVEGGKQVAVLVPTTVLAEQHYRTFCERMAEFPVTIESLSRFKTKAQQRETLERMQNGGVDIVIGTHRIVQKDVRFQDLGLLVIDEEQRFGVAAKEMLKQLRLQVDVLTLTATPIPRTLHMSLLGIRDISSLQTAPQDRQAVETKVVRFDEELIRRSIVRELNRNGQVFFVHNRVHDINEVAERIQRIVPEVRIIIAHGQMPEGQLEQAMVDFIAGRADVLVCTTIIESGVDIPNANTIFIDQADIYGLADLHQLRGRVGRYKHRAYCYLLLDESRSVNPTAKKRLKAIEEYSELGAGFKIAMRDLEIRGAGNILGTQQSGHISSVGYELYCQLLENAVRQKKGMPLKEYQHVGLDLPVSAYFPENYIPPGRHKIDIYRKLSLVSSLEQLQQLRDELRDRFGPVPIEGERLLSQRELQLFAQFWMIEEIHLEDGRFAVFRYKNAGRMALLAKRWGSDLRVVDAHRGYFLLDDPDAINEAMLDQLKEILRPQL